MADETLYGDGLLAPIPTLLAGDDGALLTVALPTLAGGTNNAILSVPIPTLVSNDGIAARNTVPIPVMSADFGMEAENTVPKPVMSADFGMEAESAVPLPTLDAAGLAGAVISSTPLTVPAPTVVSAGVAGGVLTVIESAPLPVLVGVLDNPAIITFGDTVLVPTVAAAGLTGEVSTALLGAISPIMEAVGYPAFTVTFAEALPGPILSATLTGALPETYRTWVLNLRTSALTEYDFAFTSYTVFNGKVLAVNGSGVVELGTQGVDNTTAISARVRTGKHDYESSLLKRLPRAYLNYSGGEMIYRSITSEGGTRGYALHDSFVAGIEQRRIPIGKGPKSRTWQHEIENVEGADFLVDGLLVYPVTLRRRVQ